MTQPDQLSPENAVSDTGLAALSNKTQEDWDTEIRSSVVVRVNPLLTFLGGLGLGDEFQALKEAFETLFEPLRPLLETLKDIVTDAFVGIFTGLGNLYEWITVNLGIDLTKAILGALKFIAQLGENALNMMTGFFQTLWRLFEALGGDIVLEVIGNIIEFFAEIIRNFGSLPLWKNSIAAVTHVIQVIQRITGNTFSTLNDALTDLGGFFTGFASNVGNLLQQIVSKITGTAFNLLTNPLKALEDFFAGVSADGGSLISQIVQAIIGIPGTLADLAFHFLTHIPLIGPLVYALTGRTPDDPDGAPDLGTIGAWAQNLLSIFTPVPAQNLFGQIASGLLGVIPVAHIGVTNPNLLSQASFQDADTLDEDKGWTWDETQNYAGTSAGSAKIDLAATVGTTRELFSNQNVPVTANDKLQVSAWIKTASFTGSGSPIVLSVIPFAGTTQLSTITIATSAASTSWKQLSGNYTVPESSTNQITSVQVRLAVTSAASAGSVWWDNISLTKQGVMSQTLVERLLDGWLNLWNGLFGGNSTTPRNVDDLKVAADLTRQSITNLKTAITQIESSNAASGFAGRTVFVNFTDYKQNTAALLNSSGVQTFAQTYPNPGSGGSGAAVGASTYGSGTLGVAAGAATWVNPAVPEFRDGFARYTGVSGETVITTTDYQKIGCAFASIPNNTNQNDGFNYICGRMNAPSTQGATNFVYLKLGATLCELWHVSNGNHQRLDTTSNFQFKPGATYWLECGRSNIVSGQRIFRWFENNVQLDSYTDSALVTKFGADYRYAGFGMHYSYSQALGGLIGYRGEPGDVAAFAYYDNVAAPVIGSGYRIIRPETTTVPLTVGTGMLPGSFFTQKDIETDGYTWTASTNSIKVSVPGWYMVDTRIRINGLFGPTLLSGARMTLDLYRGNTTGETLIAAGDEAIGVSGGSGGNLLASGTFMVYLNADDYVRLGYTTDRAVNILGEGTGTRAYFSITFLGNTKPKKPE